MRYALLVVLALAACDKWEHRLSKMDDFADRLCACGDGACRRDTFEEYDTWKGGWNDDPVYAGSPARGMTFIRVPAAHASRYDKLVERIRSCRSRN